MRRLLGSRFFAAMVASIATALVVGGAAWAAYNVPNVAPAATDRWYACVSSGGKVKPATMKFNVAPTGCPAAGDTIRSWKTGGDVHALHLTVTSPNTNDQIIVDDLTTCTPDQAAGPACHPAVSSATQVRLRAWASASTVFVRWSGDCTGTSFECVLTMDGTKNVTAIFEPPVQPTSATTSPTTATTTTTTPPVSGGEVTHTFGDVSCTALVNTTLITQRQDVTVRFIVPETVAPNETFTMTLPGTTTVIPASSNGLTVTEASNLSQTLQVGGAEFVPDSSTMNPATATLDPSGAGSNQSLTYLAEHPAPNRIKTTTPGPMPPGTLTTPTVTATVQAPASGVVTVSAVQMTINTKLNTSINVATTCALPTLTLATIEVAS